MYLAVAFLTLSGGTVQYDFTPTSQPIAYSMAPTPEMAQEVPESRPQVPGVLSAKDCAT